MSIMRRLALSALAVVLFMLGVGPARASTTPGFVTYTFTGEVTYVSGTPFGIGTSVGAPVSGSIAYDASLPPAWSGGGAAGYIQPAPSGMSVVISGITLASNNSSLQVLDNAWGVDDFNGYYTMPGGAISFNLADPTQTAFSSIDLPASLDVAKFSQRIGTAWDSGNLGYLTYSIDTLEPSSIPVTIDVKPGTTQNSVNPASQGVIPVAIMTTNAFDAATVDASSVRFGRTGREAAPSQWALEDVDGDGRVDVILQFATQATAIACGDTSVALTGKTMSGQVIRGTDSMTTMGCTP